MRRCESGRARGCHQDKSAPNYHTDTTHLRQFSLKSANKIHSKQKYHSYPASNATKRQLAVGFGSGPKTILPQPLS